MISGPSSPRPARPEDGNPRENVPAPNEAAVPQSEVPESFKLFGQPVLQGALEGIGGDFSRDDSPQDFPSPWRS